MKDLNFFESYIEKREFKIEKQLIFYSIAVLIIIFIILYTILNQIKISQISRDIAKLKLTVEDERISGKVKEISKKEKEVNEFKVALEKIKLLDETVKENNIIDEYILENITSRMPENVFFTSISIYTDIIQIIGVSKDKWSVAGLGKSLESIKEFKEIFVTNISSSEEHYNFTLNINLKDVNIDGEMAADEENEDKESIDQE